MVVTDIIYFDRQALEPNGTVFKIKDKMSEILPYKLRIAIKAGKEVFGNVVGMITIPAQDIKDVGTVVSLYSFQENILQGHDDRLDNFRLEEFVINIAVVTAAIFLLRRLNSLADDNVEDQSSVCRFKEKIVCCIRDILQGSSLMILMLRSDLRIRGLLGLTKMATNIGVDPSKI